MSNFEIKCKIYIHNSNSHTMQITCSRFPSLETLNFKFSGIGAPRIVAAVSTMPRWRATLTAVVIVAVAVNPSMHRTPYCSRNTCRHVDLTTNCTGEYGLASYTLGPPPAPVPRQNLWDYWNGVSQGLEVLTTTRPSVSKHWRKHKALMITSGLVSSFLHTHHWAPDGRCVALWCQCHRHTHTHKTTLWLFSKFFQEAHVPETCSRKFEMTAAAVCTG